MKAHILSAGALLMLAACTAEPPAIGPRTALHSPANPYAPAPRPGYAPVTAGYTHFTPVEPGDWRELNRRVAPQQGGQGHAH